MTDRLAEIERTFNKNWSLGKEDGDWLIAEVERLRNLDRALMAQAEKHACDLKTALANKETSP